MFIIVQKKDASFDASFQKNELFRKAYVLHRQ